MLEPSLLSLHIHLGTIFCATLEYRGVEKVLVYAVNFGEKLPSHIDGFGLEVVAEAPVTEHLEHSLVVGIVSHLFQVVMFSAHSQALLAIRRALVRSFRVTEEDVLELVHSGISKHQSRVALHYHRSRRHYSMALRSIKIEKFLSNFLRRHHFLIIFFTILLFRSPITLSVTNRHNRTNITKIPQALKYIFTHKKTGPEPDPV